MKYLILILMVLLVGCAKITMPVGTVEVSKTTVCLGVTNEGMVYDIDFYTDTSLLIEADAFNMISCYNKYVRGEVRTDGFVVFATAYENGKENGPTHTSTTWIKGKVISCFWGEVGETDKKVYTDCTTGQGPYLNEEGLVTYWLNRFVKI